MNEKYKYLFKNVGLLTLSSFATRFLSFFLVPLYTNILSTTDYGTYDLFTTTIGVLIPLLTFNIQDAVIRFALDNNYSKDAVVTIGMRLVICANCVLAVGLCLNFVFNVSLIVKEYTIFLLLMFLAQTLSGVVTCYIRGINRVTDLSISSVIASLATIILNIVFLVNLRMGLVGYFLANCLGPLVQSIYLIVRGNILWRINIREKYRDEQKEMLSYSKPLVANSLAWWINSAFDRYVVVFFCGLAENGLYAVAGKIPAILNVFQGIFNQAWELSAVKDYDPEDKSGFFSSTYRAYNCAMTLICSAIIVSDRFLARFLYAKDFYSAWEYVPWLTIAILFGALSGYMGGFFTAVKDSRIFATSTLVGAVSNIAMNLILTPFMGPMGAAIATTICYAEVFVVRYVQSKKYISLKLNVLRDSISYTILVLQSIVLITLPENFLMYGINMFLFGLVFLLYFKDIQLILCKVIHQRGRR